MHNLERRNSGQNLHPVGSSCTSERAKTATRSTVPQSERNHRLDSPKDGRETSIWHFVYMRVSHTGKLPPSVVQMLRLNRWSADSVDTVCSERSQPVPVSTMCLTSALLYYRNWAISLISSSKLCWLVPASMTTFQTQHLFFCLQSSLNTKVLEYTV